MQNDSNNPILFKPASLPIDIEDMYNALAHAQNNNEKMAAAKAVVGEYYKTFGSNGMRKDMWAMLSAAMGNPDAETMMKGRERQNLIFFYEFTLMLFDAVYVLHREK